MIHVFHGFLGSPDDFSFLQGPDVLLHNLYHFHIPEIGEDDILIGYSLGGRIALELAAKARFKIKKLVLINAHPGLETSEEVNERMHFEARILEKLTTMDEASFLEFWNRLPIFRADQPISVSPERFRASGELFTRHRLSQQENFLPLLERHRDQVLFLIGKDDEKYMQLAREKLLPKKIPVKVLDGGHRLFQDPELILATLKDEHIL